jgi:hypothetical protein
MFYESLWSRKGGVGGRGGGDATEPEIRRVSPASSRVRATGKLPGQTVNTTAREAVTMLRRLSHATMLRLDESLCGIPLDFVLLPKCLGFQFITVRVISDLVIAILHWVASELLLKEA